MKFSIVLSILTLVSAVALADGGFSNGSTGLEGYTGKEAGKAATELPEELKGIGIQEQIGKTIDLSLMVNDEAGQKVPLSSFFKAHHPVIISPVYFSCPGLCNFHLNGLTDTLKQVDWTPGKEFDVVAFSFDAKETPEMAAKKKAEYMKAYGRVGAEKGWHFVTADAETVKKFTDSVGFKFKWNEKDKQWSHASAAIVYSPDGKISRYLHGIQFEPRDVKLALNEAADGKVGNIVDSVLLFCFKYDSHQSKYGLQVFRVMKLAGAITAAALALWLIPVLIRARRENT